MKIRHPLIAAPVAGALIAPAALFASSAGAAATTQVRVTNAYSYAACHPFDYTICLDGSPLASLSTTETSDPTTVVTGSLQVSAFSGLNGNCSGVPDFSNTVTIPEGASSTLAISWPSQSNGGITVFPDDVSCVPANLGRVTFRNLAAYSGSTGLNLMATPPAQVNPAGLIANVAKGAQGSGFAPTGTFTTATANDPATNNFLADLVQAIPVSETTQQVVIAYGGNDGAIGGYLMELPSTVCQGPSTSTSAPTTTGPTTTVAATTVAHVATPVAATPTYTG